MIGLLLDQNLSFRLLSALKPDFPGSIHVSALHPGAATDLAIWEHAHREGLAIVSKDADFQHLSLLHGYPPKVIWLRVGNMSTSEIGRLLETRIARIKDFLDEDGAAYLVLAD